MEPWSLGAEVNYGLYNLGNSKSDFVEANTKGGLTGAFLVYYRLNDKLLLSTGLGTSLIDYNVIDYSPSMNCDLDGDGNYDKKSSSIVHRDRVYALQIPVFATIYFGKKSNQFYLKPGLSLLMIVDRYKPSFWNGCGEPPWVSIDLYHKLNNVQVQSEINMGYEFGIDLPNKVLERLRYRLELGMEYFLSSAFDARYATGQFWAVGGSIGVRYKL